MMMDQGAIEGAMDQREIVGAIDGSSYGWIKLWMKEQ